VSTETAVVALAAAIYLLDCVVLLERGQALWSRGGLSFGSLHYQVRGKVVALLNPFTPFLPVLRTRPLLSPAAGIEATQVREALAPLVGPAALQFVLLFAVLPWCLYRAPGWPFLSALALAYLNAMLMLALIAWRFGRAGLARAPLAALGVGWLACLPLSVNSARKAGLAFDAAADAPQAIRGLPAQARPRALAGLAAQVAEAMQELDDGDARHGALAEVKRALDADAALLEGGEAGGRS
jgi:hypothetical protein